jgi:hypothetical protein
LLGTRLTTACLAATFGAVAAWGVNESLWRIREARNRAEESRNAERAQATIDDLQHDLARSREDSRRLEADVETAKKSAAAP